MATSYDEIYNNFLYSVTDYNMLSRTQEETDRELFRLMNKAVGEIEDMVFNTTGIDLTLRDDTKQEFEEDLPMSLITLIGAGMNYHWYLPHYLNIDHMKNVLSTRDFNQSSTANLMNSLYSSKQELDDTWRRARSFFAQRYSKELRTTKTVTSDPHWRTKK